MAVASTPKVIHWCPYGNVIYIHAEPRCTAKLDEGVGEDVGLPGLDSVVTRQHTGRYLMQDTTHNSGIVYIAIYTIGAQLRSTCECIERIRLLPDDNGPR